MGVDTKALSKLHTSKIKKSYTQVVLADNEGDVEQDGLSYVTRS